MPPTPGSLHLLDDDYLGQAAVRRTRGGAGIPGIPSSYAPHENHTSALTTVFVLLQHMLSKVGTWTFDIFLFDRLTNGKMTLLLTLYNFLYHDVTPVF